MKEWLDPKLILQIVTIAGGAIGFCLLKFNDFSHLEDNQKDFVRKLEKVDEKQDEFAKTLNNIANDISYIKGYSDAVKQARK